MTQRRRKRRSKAAAGLRWWILKRLLVPAGVLLAAGIVASIWYADRLCDVFQAREQQVSSRLLGRSYELTPGSLGSAGELVRRLDRLGYERVRKSVTEPGTYTVWSNAVQVYLRQSRDAGGEHPARVAQVRFEDGRIRSVDRKDAFLEPETLSLFYGPEMEERELVEVSDCPRKLIDAIIAAEDHRFFTHPGIDPIGILRAAWANVSSGSLSQGGSTLTQQLAKNLYFTDERSFTRKAKEALAAVVLEARYSKQRLLRAYLNEVYLGQRGPASIRGVGRAARYYFGKPVGDLDLAESALLAGLIQTPGRYNPFMHPEAARKRRNIVLKAMEEIGAITPEERRATAALPVRVVSPGARGHMASAAYVSEEIRNELIGSYGSRFWQEGLAVRTSIDPLYQEAAEKAVDEGLERLAKDYRSTRKSHDGKPLQAALVSVDLHDGSILALVGGRDFALSQFNRATTARRQPGSLFKPVVYMAGLTHPATDEDEGPGWLERFRRRWSSSDGVVSLRPDREVVPVRKKKHHWWSWGEPDDEEEEVPEPAPPAFPLTAASILYDEPYQVESGGKLWSPQNYDHEFRGRVTMQEALEESLNVPTARAAAAIGLDRVVETARALGIRSPIQEVPSIALGTADVTPLEMATAFATIADDGKIHEPFLIRGIQDGSGKAQSLQAGWP
ncbi:MAG TPA: transglycosylase domain-containing protein, partial [Candidatus Saccharimonadales bacterium]|nr:transglycosylase domain-containing protein [Candidatus Saccharimonadales bacterium]